MPSSDSCSALPGAAGVAATAASPVAAAAATPVAAAATPVAAAATAATPVTAGRRVDGVAARLKTAVVARARPAASPATEPARQHAADQQRLPERRRIPAARHSVPAAVVVRRTRPVVRIALIALALHADLLRLAELVANRVGNRRQRRTLVQAERLACCSGCVEPLEGGPPGLRVLLRRVGGVEQHRGRLIPFRRVSHSPNRDIVVPWLYGVDLAGQPVVVRRDLGARCLELALTLPPSIPGKPADTARAHHADSDDPRPNASAGILLRPRRGRCAATCTRVSPRPVLHARREVAQQPG